MQNLFDRVTAAAPAFPECAPVGCDTLNPPTPRTDMRLKAQRGLLGAWLNLVTGRLTRGRPIDLAALTTAATAGEALAEIEATVCDPDATRSDLATAKEIADALNAPAGDLELASAESSATVQPGTYHSFILAIANMSEDVRNYDLTSAGAWPVSLSATRVNGLGPGQLGMVTATLFVPGGTASEIGEVQVTATDSSNRASLVRTATVRILVNGAVNPGGGGNLPRRLQQ